MAKSGRVRRWIIAVVILLLVGGGVLYKVAFPGSNDYPMGISGKEIEIDIPKGATGLDIAHLLFEHHVVKSSGAFYEVAVADPRSGSIAPGSHLLEERIPALQALDQLLDRKRIPNLLKITEGEWSDEILKKMVGLGFSAIDLAAALASLQLPPGFTGSEGVFFPAQYSFPRGTPAGTALQGMVDRFKIEADSSGLSRVSESFTPMDLLTIASLIQAEGDPKDFAKISSVIRNRLRIGMPLQFDTTVHYIRRIRGQVFLSLKATQIPSPYNTYKHRGLPPGPINNPGRLAMEAALAPLESSWIYFITVKPVDTRFTGSSAEFLRWKILFERNMAAGAFGANK